jgi:two-component system, cell cycle sensor histidine kinase and response regulator CckA
LFPATLVLFEAERVKAFRDLTEEVDYLRRQLARESAARLEAERIAESATWQLYEEQRKLVLLKTISEAANQANDIGTAVDVALEKICRHAKWNVGHLLLCVPSDAKLTSARLWYFDAPQRYEAFQAATELMTFARAEGLPGRVWASAAPAWIQDVTQDSNFPRAAVASASRLNSAFAFPLLAGTSVVGIMEFFAENAAEPDQSFLDLMRQVGTQLGRVVERQRSHERLERSEAYYRRLTDHALDLITILEADGTIRYESQSIQTVLGYSPEDYRGRNAFDFIHPDDKPEVARAFQEALLKHGNTPLLNFRFLHKDGSYRILEGRGNNLLDDPIVTGVIFNSRDVTERRKLEEQFHQSQKVQAIGQLAGGVAHDFNNILTAIGGYSDLLLRQVPQNSTLFPSLREIRRATDRAASLTRQLLAFSRKQVLEPRIIDLNVVVSDMDKMLRRLLGANIDLVTQLSPGLGRVKADPGQLAQVIMNLAVNARDAMPGSGKLTIETANTAFDAGYLRPREVPPGDYVMLAISDNGIGMSAEVKARLFEPFFTTKEVGKGTGLGLATSHGIVKQSGGHIIVYSELGHGTTFKIFLPRVEGAVENSARADEPREWAKGHETVLLVEDEATIRELGQMVLSDLGYEVIPAENGLEALRAIEQSGRPIDILVTDVVMPEMGGTELADKLRSLSPHTKVLFCSGYTQDAIVRDGVLQPGIEFIQKPYSVAVLASRVREVLAK